MYYLLKSRLTFCLVMACPKRTLAATHGSILFLKQFCFVKIEFLLALGYYYLIGLEQYMHFHREGASISNPIPGGGRQADIINLPADPCGGLGDLGDTIIFCSSNSLVLVSDSWRGFWVDTITPKPCLMRCFFNFRPPSGIKKNYCKP